ncbi:hypothetical protein [Cyclobacterium plantarum]|uniref:hypothetical protein n=1 Tax=Cyclobacterium plantarum TaxID=2716263 RepID=UPI003F6FC72B
MKKNLKELSLEDCKKIRGGDNLTQRFFYFIGSVTAGIVAGQPYGAYGRYAGMK